MKRRQVYLPERQIETLLAIFEETGIKVSEQIRRAIDDYLKKVKKENKDG